MATSEAELLPAAAAAGTIAAAAAVACIVYPAVCQMTLVGRAQMAKTNNPQLGPRGTGGYKGCKN